MTARCPKCNYEVLLTEEQIEQYEVTLIITADCTNCGHSWSEPVTTDIPS